MQIMEINQSNADRAIRFMAGVALLSIAFIGPQTVWGILGVIPIVTGMSGFDPLYWVLDVSTRRNRAGARGM
jgi:hypothetical protein